MNRLKRKSLYLWTCIRAAGLIGYFAGTPAIAKLGDQLFKLTASDAAMGDFFGSSLAISGNVALVGAYLHDDAGPESGAAYVFDLTTGQQIHKLTAADATRADYFGSSVALSGEIALVSSLFGNTPSSVYVFDVTTGKQLSRLNATDPATSNGFGRSLAMNGNIAIIASPFEDAGKQSGSAYLFDVTTGQELLKLTASDGAAGDQFSLSVAMNDKWALIGAAGNDEHGFESGSAYVFDVKTGQEIFKLSASDAAEGDLFGNSVAISGNTAVIGARFADGAGSDSGAAYVFDVTTGQQLFKLTASTATASDNFGVSVAVSGNIALVGSPGDDAADIDSGVAYLFDITTGKELARLMSSDASAFDRFGERVAISGHTALIGVFYDDDAGSHSGSAYVFSATPEPTGAILLATAAVGFCIFVVRSKRHPQIRVGAVNRHKPARSEGNRPGQWL